MAFVFDHYYRSVPKEYLSPMFELLADNMSVIAPTGNSREEDRQTWLEQAVPQFEHVILIFDERHDFLGYFRYRLKDSTFWMDDIQFASSVQDSGLFAALYRYLVTLIPEETEFAEATTNQNNVKGHQVLESLGLRCVGVTKNGRNDRYRGRYRSILEKYGNGSRSAGSLSEGAVSEAD